MAEFKVKTTCASCSGTKVLPDGSPCSTCNQTGYTFDSTIMDLEEIDSIMEGLANIRAKVDDTDKRTKDMEKDIKDILAILKKA